MLIALAGKKGSGKDTAANLILQLYPGITFYVTAFADPIKDALNTIFGWGNSAWWPENKERVDPRWGISPRQAAQHLGTEWGQYGLCADFPEFSKVTKNKLWCKSALSRCRQHPYSIITDMRFFHEYVEVKKVKPSFVIKLVRNSGNHDEHPSERSVDSIIPDVTIANTGTVEALRSILEETLDSVL